MELSLLPVLGAADRALMQMVFAPRKDTNNACRGIRGTGPTRPCSNIERAMTNCFPRCHAEFSDLNIQDAVKEWLISRVTIKAMSVL